MKIAVLSDIHGNLPALKAVVAHIDAWRPEQVIVAGDIVNRGPLSADCLHFVRDRVQRDGWQVIKGNHEDFVIACGRPDSPQNGPEYEVWRFAHWAYRQLKGDVSYLRSLPNRYSWIAPDGSEFRVVHASMRNNRDGIYPHSMDAELEKQIAPAPAVFVTAHTHQPLSRRLNSSLIVNVGAVGAPFDRDTQAGYGQFTWDGERWQGRVVRLPYDRVQTERDYASSGFLEGAGPLAQLMLVELRRAGGLIYRWAEKYEDAVLAGDVLIEDTVREMLAAEDLRPFLGPPGWVL